MTGDPTASLDVPRLKSHSEDKNMDVTLPYVERLTDSKKYIYRLTRWLGSGFDVDIWWKLPTGGCRFFQSYTGETAEESSIRKFHEAEINSKKFDFMLKRLIANGILELQSDLNPGILNNRNEYYYVSLKDGSSNIFRAASGHHRDPRFQNIVDIIVENMKGKALDYKWIKHKSK